MAYAALVSLTQTLSQILKHHQYGIFLDEKQRLKSLHKHVEFLQAFLEDFPEKAKDLEGRIRDAANHAEDIIEYLLFEEIRSLNSSGSSRQSGRSNAHGLHLTFRRQHQKLPGVTGDIESIVTEVMGMKNSLRIQDLQPSDSSSPTSSEIQASDSSPTPSSVIVIVPTRKDNKNDAMVGLEEDILAVNSRLCGESRRREFIPIYGMGGIGKTTLARSAYDDPLIVEHFDIRAWVTVSQDYSVPEMLFTLVDSIKAFSEKFDEEKHSYEQMAEHVYKNLKRRRYLVVLDDMWSTKAWDDVRRIFPDDGNGSRIIITTRLQDVAAYADSSSPLHEMRFMDVDQSWILLQQKVFNEQHCPPELENIGKMIARSCKGLPLAIVVIAGILLTVNQTQASWKDIAKKVNLAVNDNNEQFAKILALSYYHLPHHLRPCFLYMGGFPEDYEIHVSKLVKLWVAEGFLKPSVSKSFEEGAEECLEDLVRRSLVLVTRRKSNGKIKSCSVHDLVRDLCIRKAREERFLLYATDRHADRFLPKGIKDQRRLSIARSTLTLFSKVNSPIIRTALYFEHCRRLSSSLASFRLLRVLDLVVVVFREFPAEVLKFFHLRYLAFTFTGDFDIPASILKLHNLQTLFIRPYFKILLFIRSRVGFPLEIWRMPQLRHLLLPMLYPLPNPSAGTFVLKNLQTLALVRNFKCSKRIVQMIPNLSKLGVLYDGDGIQWQEYHLHNLVDLHRLEKLKIWIADSSREPFPLWEKLAFPVMLKKLTLIGCLVCGEDMTTVGSLPNLEVMKLTSCSFEGCKWETTEGEFPRLKFLKIRLTNLQHWVTESSHFPSLEQLQLCSCESLGEIPDVIGEIPTLQIIEVNRKDKSLVKSAKRIKKEQQSFGNDSLQVRIVQE
ncbi:putative late blight resistance proteinR1B-16 [Sesamum alatum]|uniref:Late blight resistance proteinR1B-16 n=1 Tax=Sesamum alatum TaxID=300844 RepID=A0AAE1YMS4_9LAMI|nr:putative late blight resistance proteinR1B-16 [Sesamum alatum]